MCGLLVIVSVSVIVFVSSSQSGSVSRRLCLGLCLVVSVWVFVCVFVWVCSFLHGCMLNVYGTHHSSVMHGTLLHSVFKRPFFSSRKKEGCKVDTQKNGRQGLVTIFELHQDMSTFRFMYYATQRHREKT